MHCQSYLWKNKYFEVGYRKRCACSTMQAEADEIEEFTEKNVKQNFNILT